MQGKRFAILAPTMANPCINVAARYAVIVPHTGKA
jgi:hypothetical protein